MLWLCIWILAYDIDKYLMIRFLKCWKFPSSFTSDANLCFLLHRHLSELALLYCQRIGDAGLLQIGQGCKYLQALHLVDCSSIGDEAMCGIASGCKNLKKLHIRRCYEVLFAFEFALNTKRPFGMCNFNFGIKLILLFLLFFVFWFWMSRSLSKFCTL